MRKSRRLHALALAGVACATLLAACSSSSSPGSSSGATRIQGGTATIALNQTSGVFNYIFPLLDFDNDTFANVTYSQYLMWRPLYWFGSPGHVGLDEKESLADPASVTSSGGKTVATIQLKSYRWSDGTPLTTRDVEFWINLLKADKAQFWGYSPGEFPDNLTANGFKALSNTKFQLTFSHTYSAEWLYNQLDQIIPLPQQAWDKESPTGPVGNYDTTTAGAAAVDSFLLAQNKDTSTYATNPLWQVVDGPWKLTSYANNGSGDATYVRNLKYSGPATGSLHAIKVLSYSSDTAEFDELLSSTGVDYGYVPYPDAAQVSRVKSDGYTVQPWTAWGINYVFLNYSSAQSGAIFKQLYVREAMQHLINQAGYISAFLQGYAYPTYGPVPTQPASQFVSPQQTHNPDPYDPAEATSILSGHGWAVKSGTETCVRAGSASNECGSGIASGATMSFPFLYANGSTGVDEEVASLQSSFGAAGIKLTPSGLPFGTATQTMTPGCTGPKCWQFAYVGEAWVFDPGYNEPDGSILFKTNGPSNLGGYSNPQADADMGQLGSGGISAFYKYEDYVAKQLPGLWMPQTDFQISAVNSKLQGVLPQDPLSNIYPEDWYFVK
jgi:peptide/nickel transport system substrate-binding protein